MRYNTMDARGHKRGNPIGDHCGLFYSIRAMGHQENHLKREVDRPVWCSISAHIHHITGYQRALYDSKSIHALN